MKTKLVAALILTAVSVIAFANPAQAQSCGNNGYYNPGYNAGYYSNSGAVYHGLSRTIGAH